MGGRHNLVRSLAVASLFMALVTRVSAQPAQTMRVRVIDTTAATASQKPATPAPGTSVTAAPQTTPSELADDGLRKDPRWAQMRSCIENTATPKEFDSCLHSVLMTDSTGVGTAFTGTALNAR